MSRENLPYRVTCEGYFFRNGLVLARSAKGYVQFPGGGVGEGETPSDALKRETLEETGVSVKKLQELSTIVFDWSPVWPITQTQKSRYELFRGEEIHVFVGEVGEMKRPTSSEDAWRGTKWLKISTAITLLEKNPCDESMEEYRSQQLMVLKTHV